MFLWWMYDAPYYFEHMEYWSDKSYVQVQGHILSKLIRRRTLFERQQLHDRYIHTDTITRLDMMEYKVGAITLELEIHAGLRSQSWTSFFLGLF